MKLKIAFEDGDVDLDGVVSFSNAWAGDEYVFTAEHRDGSETRYTGPELYVVEGREDGE